MCLGLDISLFSLIAWSECKITSYFLQFANDPITELKQNTNTTTTKKIQNQKINTPQKTPSPRQN